MISTRKLIKMAKKWQRVASLRRKRISLPRSSRDTNQNASNAPSVADKGHFVVYTADKKRFSFPITYLNNPILRELLKMSEEEFGLPSDGPITLPCDAIFMEYIVSLIQQGADKITEKALLMSTATSRCLHSYSLHHGQSSQQLLVCSL
ncbi:auxin-responsive protein SAUR68-like [Carica papaya]|uniref:auxin-responsive protein SAUR68-like n=1 Tax=Carica papaya TaxID=3649 RepID=UPI000B8CF2F8|nr:auxin-responsive protein SAUR68-like [Carica papaya]